MVYDLVLSVPINQTIHSDLKQMKVSVSNPGGDFYDFLDRSIETRKLLKTSLEQCKKIKLSVAELSVMRAGPSVGRAANREICSKNNSATKSNGRGCECVLAQAYGNWQQTMNRLCVLS